MAKREFSCQAILLLAISSGFANGHECGGLLEGDYGEFHYAPATRAGSSSSLKSCVWIIQAYGANAIQFTLNELVAAGDGGTGLVLYPEKLSGDGVWSPITLSAKEATGTASNVTGSTIIVILPAADSLLTFTWTSIMEEDVSSVTGPLTIADYVQAPEGKLVWRPRRREEKILWVISTGDAVTDVEYSTQADLSACNEACHPCSCLNFALFQLDSEGYLVEVERACDSSSNGSLQLESHPIVVSAAAKATDKMGSQVKLHWASAAAAVSDTPTHIYFTTDNRGVMAYSLETSNVTSVLRSSEYLNNIVYDPWAEKIYCSTYGKIYRANLDGTDIETVWRNSEYPYLDSYALDWITGNLYKAATYGIFVCNTTISRGGNMSCSSILTGYIRDIALNPLQGEMYFQYLSGIWRAGMDGSNAIPIVPSIDHVNDIAIDAAASRLYWVEWNKQRIQTSYMNGSNVETIIQLPAQAHPGVPTLINDRMYWNIPFDGILLSSTNRGDDIRTHYNATSWILSMAVIAPRNYYGGLNIVNPCESHTCSHSCVRTAISSRCLCPEGMRLQQDQRTCAA